MYLVWRIYFWLNQVIPVEDNFVQDFVLVLRHKFLTFILIVQFSNVVPRLALSFLFCLLSFVSWFIPPVPSSQPFLARAYAVHCGTGPMSISAG